MNSEVSNNISQTLTSLIPTKYVYTLLNKTVNTRDMDECFNYVLE